jgi:hypothetical protein
MHLRFQITGQVLDTLAGPHNTYQVLLRSAIFRA